MTQVRLLEELNHIETNREDIIKQMQTYKESYTKEDLFDKIINDAFRQLGDNVMSRLKRISLLIILL